MNIYLSASPTIHLEISSSGHPPPRWYPLLLFPPYTTFKSQFKIRQTNTDSQSLYSGGEEVLLDVGGQDATEAFEDVGHSDEAREILDGLLVGTLKRMV